MLVLLFRFVMGSNKVLQVALGKTPADELRTNLSLLSAKLAGQVGLCFTSVSKDEVRAAATVTGCSRRGLSSSVAAEHCGHMRLQALRNWCTIAAAFAVNQLSCSSKQ